MSISGVAWFTLAVGCLISSEQSIPDDAAPTTVSVCSPLNSTPLATARSAPVLGSLPSSGTVLWMTPDLPQASAQLRSTTNRWDQWMQVLGSVLLVDPKPTVVQTIEVPGTIASAPPDFSPCAIAASPSVPQASSVQVRVRDCWVAAVSDWQEAQTIAQQVEQFVRDPKAQSGEIHPIVENGRPGVRVADRTLFTVNPDTADLMGGNLDQTAITWANQLRIALAQAPLDLTAAQMFLYGLRETGQKLQGLASWYGPYFHGRTTATGEIFNQSEFTAAHPSLPFDTFLKVTNVQNRKSVIVRINDRGPYVGERVLDLSQEAARSLDSESSGVILVEAEIMQPQQARPPIVTARRVEAPM